MISELENVTKKRKIGVIGLGNMGRGITKNLIKAGNTVFVWDISETARNLFKNNAKN